MMSVDRSRGSLSFAPQNQCTLLGLVDFYHPTREMNRENVFYKVDGTEDSYKVDAESAANAANSPSLEESTSGYLASYIQLIQVRVSIGSTLCRDLGVRLKKPINRTLNASSILDSEQQPQI